MQVKSIAECWSILQGEHSTILLTFIKLLIVIKIFVLSISKWPIYTGFTVQYVYALAGITHKVQVGMSVQ